MKRSVAALAIAAVSVAAAIAGFSFNARAEEAAVSIRKLQGASWHPELGQTLFVAVMGSDARSGSPDAGGGCDSIHIVAISPSAKAGTILNFPRDAYLPSPSGGSRKLTDTCRLSGFEAVIRILTTETGIPIQYYVKTEFSHFRAFIDELGGIDVDIPYAMNDQFSGANFRKGTMHLSGAEALAFTRNRHDTPNGDFSRTDNQGLLMVATLKKFRAEVTDPHRMLDYVRVARRHVKVTVPITELVKMGMLAVEIDPGSVHNLTIPGSTGSAGGASVVFLAPGDIYQRVRDDGVY